MPPAAPSDLEHVVERFDHVALGAWNVEDAVPLVEFLGGRFRNGGDNEPGRIRWIQYFLPQAGKIEIIAPLDRDDGDHFLVRFLHEHGPGLHHMTFKVADLDAAVAAAAAAGYEVVGHDASYPGWKEAFLHPKTTGGVVIQLAEFSDRAPPPIGAADVVAGVPEND